MSEVEERVSELEYKVHELREEINMNYKHISGILSLLKDKYPDAFLPGPGAHLKSEKQSN